MVAASAGALRSDRRRADVARGWRARGRSWTPRTAHSAARIAAVSSGALARTSRSRSRLVGRHLPTRSSSFWSSPGRTL